MNRISYLQLRKFDLKHKVVRRQTNINMEATNIKCTCAICCSEFNIRRKPIECCHCKFIACSQCIKTYLMDSPNEQHCMNCRVGWTLEFVKSMLPVTWLRTYNKLKLKVHVDKMLARIPQVQIDHESFIRIYMMRRDYRLLMKEKECLNSVLNTIFDRRMTKNTNKKGDVAEDEHDVIEIDSSSSDDDDENEESDMKEDNKKSKKEEKVQELPKYRHSFIREEDLEIYKMYLKREEDIDQRIGEMVIEHDINLRHNDVYESFNRYYTYLCDKKRNKNSEEKPRVICNCPVDDCKGFITSKNYTCGVCESILCRKCHVHVKTKIGSENDKHSCKKDDIDTARKILMETKPCIKCNVPIYKISGCDQMWCVICHTAFNWRTGKEEFRVHNPHAYQYYRSIGRDIPAGPVNIPNPNATRDNVCGDIDHTTVTQRWRNRYECPEWIDNVFRARNHINAITISSLSRFLRHKDHIVTVDILRLMLKSINDKEFTKLCLKRKTVLDKAEDVRSIFQTFMDVTGDILASVTPDNHYIKQRELQSCRKFINNDLSKISSKRSKPILISETLVVNDYDRIPDEVSWLYGKCASLG